MDEKQKQIDELKQKIQTAERDLDAAKRALFELTGDNNSNVKVSGESEVSGEIIEGDFNGENMVGPGGKVYPVPANYASKSKLVEGDRLKLTISDDGTFLFKQIQPVNRERVVAELGFSDNAYHAIYNGKNFNVLYASVTYHKAKPGDRVAIIIPEGGNSDWAALENVIHNAEEEKAFLESNKEEIIDQPNNTESKNTNIIEPLNNKDNKAQKERPTLVDNNPQTTTEKVIEPLKEDTNSTEKPDILGVGDIKIEEKNNVLQETVVPEQPKPTSNQQVHPLEAKDTADTQQIKQEEKPVEEMEI